MRRYTAVIGMAFAISILLTGCFRDAGNKQITTTGGELPDVAASLTPTVPIVSSPTQTLIPSLTPMPEVSPTETFPVGGPPVSSPTASATTIVQVTPVTNASATSTSVPVSTSTPPGGAPSTTPTGEVPSTTPAGGAPSTTPTASGGTFGDSGITPTGLPPTLAPPDALVTPTEIVIPVNPCVHVVQPGDTLFRIAIDNNTTVDEMLAANPQLGFNASYLQLGQELTIPGCVPPTPTPDPNAPTAAPTNTAAPEVPTATQDPSVPPTYTVVEGDTLFRIATNHGITVDALLAANPQLGGSTLIQPGMVLTIPPAQ